MFCCGSPTWVTNACHTGAGIPTKVRRPCRSVMPVSSEARGNIKPKRETNFSLGADLLEPSSAGPSLHPNVHVTLSSGLFQTFKTVSHSSLNPPSTLTQLFRWWNMWLQTATGPWSLWLTGQLCHICCHQLRWTDSLTDLVAQWLDHRAALLALQHVQGRFSHEGNVRGFPREVPSARRAPF